MSNTLTNNSQLTEKPDLIDDVLATIVSFLDDSDDFLNLMLACKKYHDCFYRKENIWGPYNIGFQLSKFFTVEKHNKPKPFVRKLTAKHPIVSVLFDIFPNLNDLTIYDKDFDIPMVIGRESNFSLNNIRKELRWPARTTVDIIIEHGYQLEKLTFSPCTVIAWDTDAEELGNSLTKLTSIAISLFNTAYNGKSGWGHWCSRDAQPFSLKFTQIFSGINNS
jgi:hypothetical protein